MRLLASGFTTAEASSFVSLSAGERAGIGVATGNPKGIKVSKIVAFTGGSTLGANSSGGLTFRYGASSGAVVSTLVILPFPQGSLPISSAVSVSPFQVTLEDLNIECGWFEVASHEAATGGWGCMVFGD